MLFGEFYGINIFNRIYNIVISNGSRWLQGLLLYTTKTDRMN